MRIDGRNIHPASGLNRISRPKATGASTQIRETAEVRGEDRLTLSPRAVQARGFEPALSVLPSVRADLVDRLRGEIERGEYTVDPYRLADLLIRMRVVEP